MAQSLGRINKGETERETEWGWGYFARTACKAIDAARASTTTNFSVSTVDVAARVAL